MSETSNPRDIAVRALGDRAGNVSAHLDRLLAQDPVTGADASLARELALGAIRRRGTLDAVLRAFLQRPDESLPSPLEEILHVALYQLLYLDRVPAFAAVDEAVKQTQRFDQPRHSGLVNGLLRSVGRSLGPPVPLPPPLARDTLPLSPTSHRLFMKRIFADPVARPHQYLAEAFSLPAVLAERWVKAWGFGQAVQLGFHANARAPLVLRVNRLRGDVPKVLAMLQAAGVPAAAHVNGLSVVLLEPQNITALDVFVQGLVQPQDATATEVALAAEVRPGMRVLDFCAAPGGKTTHLAELMNNTGEIVAMDVAAEKLGKIQDNCRRLGISIVRPLGADQAGGLEPHSFDAVLADVPCSNSGVLSRRAEARWRITPQRVTALAKDQRKLLALARQFVKPGGRMVYSTCSIEPEECESVVKPTAQRLGLEILKQRHTVPAGTQEPTRWRDGGFHAVLRAK